MSELPIELYTPQQVRELDRRALEDENIPGAELMARAGRAAYRRLRRHWPHARRIVVLCGGGNNGGDGYVLARLAARDDLAVQLHALVPPEELHGDAAEVAAAWSRTHRVHRFHAGALAHAEVIVDALLGTGLDRPVTGEFAEAVEAANRSPAPILALDTPSGISGLTGVRLGTAIRAAETVSFIGLKQGLFTADAPAHTGHVSFAGLDVPPRVFEGITPSAWRVDVEGLAAALPPRSRIAHKGAFGHVLLIGGDVGLGGAVRLAGEAAVRVGSGLASVATRPIHVPAVLAARPELMCLGVDATADLEPVLERASVLAVGPGLGRGGWGRALLERALAAGLPMVVDADALNLLAEAPPQRRDNWILTPHPGEAARLLGTTAAEVQHDRFAAARELQQRFGGVVVLKGAGTLIAGPESLHLCSSGNPGMASGGMGDVLTGVIAGLLAQGLLPEIAATIGVSVHAAAADRAASAGGERGLLAGDLLDLLRSLVNPK
jgi:NAD(P)H-hydrate epimerase